MNNIILKPEDLGRLVYEARKAQQLTQEDLAGMTSTGRRFIVDLEKGKHTAQIGKVLVVLGALGIALIASSKWKS
ncbi:MAG: helix-turn-helix domain-containing protein [Alphaproteobacteria bacterium]|nr:helix-turn-helix domain-containing protein [Alphaproteobacteria bacterium]